MHFPTQKQNRPSRIRYYVVFVTFCMAFLLYLHRFCMSYAQRYVREDLGLSNEDLSLCFSAFFLSYAIAQVPSGWLSDRFGARIMLTLYILVWSFFTATMGLTVGFVSLLVVRLATGVGQAGAYPTAAALIARWIPVSARGFASGLVAWGGRLGGGLAPILTTTLIVFYVPSDTPTKLEARDLINPDQLRETLSSAARQVKRTDFTKPGPATIRGWQALFWHVVKTGGEMPAGYDQVVSLPAASGKVQSLTDQQLRQALNAFITNAAHDPARSHQAIPLERETRQLWTKKEITLPERQRLNRLILESILPDAIRKLYGHGWRQVMWTYGAAGIVIALAFWIVFRNRPEQHALCNAAERDLIGGGHSKPLRAAVAAPPFRRILTSRSLWLMCVSQWGSNVGWVFLVTWLPRFLLEVHQVPLFERGWMAAIPLWVGWAGMLLGGPATDYAARKLGLRWGRMLPMIMGRFGAMAAYLLCLFHPSPWALTALFGVVAFSNDFGSPSSWAYKQDVGGRYIGSVHGWANMWGNLGATVSPVLLNLVVKSYSWDMAFGICACSYLVAGLATLGVDATIPIDTDR